MPIFNVTIEVTFPGEACASFLIDEQDEWIAVSRAITKAKRIDKFKEITSPRELQVIIVEHLPPPPPKPVVLAQTALC